VILFAVLATFYLATFSFRNISDTDLNSYQTRALALHGDADLSRYAEIAKGRGYKIHRGDNLYSIYGVGVSLTAVPLYALFARLDLSDRFLQGLTATLLVVGAMLILFRLLLRLFPRSLAVAATVIYGFGTTMWPLAAMAFFQNGPASFYQALGITGLFSDGRRAPLLAGFGFAAAAFVRPTHLIPLAVIGLVYLSENRTKTLLYIAGAVAPISGLLIQNRWIWGDWLTGGYSKLAAGFHGNVPRALWSFLFGWWRGMFVYSPVLLIGIAGGVLAWRRLGRTLDRKMAALGLSSLMIVLAYARSDFLGGGSNQFGYRYLLDIVPFLVVLIAFGLARAPRLKTIAIPLGALSIMTMAFGAARNEFGWDFVYRARTFTDASIGQAWIVFVHRPWGSVLRLCGVAALWALMYRMAGSDRTSVDTRRQQPNDESRSRPATTYP
jgi:hypothetical protein